MMKPWLLCCLWGAWLTGAIGLAQQPAPKPSEDDRYLFAVDTSLAMAPLKETLRNTVYDMIYSGLGGQTRRGDSMGVWAFNEHTYPQPFPPLDWSLERRENLAAQAYEFLKTRRFEKRSQPDLLLKDLAPLIKGSRRLTVFILSNGAQPIQGTPYDDLVNAVYRERGPTLRRAGKPVITVLTATDGKIVAWAVTSVGESFVLPLSGSAAAIAAADRTLPGGANAIPGAAPAGSTSPGMGLKNEIPIPPAKMVVVQPVRIESEPIVPAPPVDSTQDMPLAGTAQPEASGDNPAARPAGEIRPPTPGPPSEPGKLASPTSVANASEPASLVEPRLASSPQATGPEDPSGASALRVASVPAELATASKPAGTPVQWGFLCIGAGLALGAITLVILLIRLNRRACRPSYISQSIGQRRR